jgi:uncharacterized membrane protein
MISYTSDIVIKAPVNKVFAFTNDVTTMPSWLTGLVEVRNVIGTGEGQQCEWTFKLVGVRLRGEAVTVDCIENERCTHQSIGMFNATWTIYVEPQDGGTKLSMGVEYTLPGAVLGKLAEHLTIRRMVRDLQSSLLNLKEMLEG